MPALAGGVDQRHGGEPLGHLLEAGIGQGRQACLAHRSIDGGVVWQPGGVPQQVAYRHFGFCHAPPEFHSPGAGQVLRNRRVELELPFFLEDHCRDADDRLGHRVDAEDRVLAHRLLRGDVHQPVSLEVGDLAAAGDDGDRAGQLFFVEELLNFRIDLRETPGRKPHLLGGGEGQVLSGSLEDGQEQGCEEQRFHLPSALMCVVFRENELEHLRRPEARVWRGNGGYSCATTRVCTSALRWRTCAVRLRFTGDLLLRERAFERARDRESRTRREAAG